LSKINYIKRNDNHLWAVPDDRNNNGLYECLCVTIANEKTAIETANLTRGFFEPYTKIEKAEFDLAFEKAKKILINKFKEL